MASPELYPDDVLAYAKCTACNEIIWTEPEGLTYVMCLMGHVVLAASEIDNRTEMQHYAQPTLQELSDAMDAVYGRS